MIGEARIKARELATAEVTAALTTDPQVAPTESTTPAVTDTNEVPTVEGDPLAPLQATIARYEAAAQGMLATRTAAMSEAAKAAIVGLPESMSALERLNWLDKNASLFQPVGDGVGTPRRPAANHNTVPAGPAMIGNTRVRL